MKKPKVLAVTGTKGGIGKTTCTANLGALIHQVFNKKVLFIDSDSQPALSDYYRLDGESAEYGLVDIFKNPSLITKAISKTEVGCDIVLSNDFNRNIESELAQSGVFDVIYRLGKAVDNLQHLDYDYVIIDCPGSTNTIHKAAIMAADKIICPVTPDHMAFREFPRGTLSMIKQIERNLEEQIVAWKDLAPIYCVIYRKENTIDSDDHVEALKNGLTGIFEGLKAQTTSAELSERERAQAQLLLDEHDFLPKDGFITCDTIVPRHVIYNKATTAKVPVHSIEKSTKPNNANDVMRALAFEILGQEELENV